MRGACVILTGGDPIAKPGRTTFEKRRREQDRKEKQEEKRKDRAQRKEIKKQGAVAQSHLIFIRKWNPQELETELNAAMAIWADLDEGPLTQDQATDLITDKNELRWAVVVKDTKEVIGNCEFLEKSGPFEMKLQIRRSEWGRGIGLEAATLALEYVRENYTEAHFSAKTTAGNQRGIRLLKKLGFSHESTAQNELHFLQ